MSTQQQGKRLCNYKSRNSQHSIKWLLLAAQRIWSSGKGGIKIETIREGKGKKKRKETSDI